MIKVNLLKGTGGSRQGTSGTSVDTNLSEFDFGPKKTNSKVKLLLLIVPIISILGFRQYNYFMAKNELETFKKKNQEVSNRLRELDAAVKEVERFQEEKRKLTNQIEVIKRLSKERLRNVKSLDALQTLIPGKAWINSLKVLDTKLEIEGFADNDIVISEFMQSLDSSIYFKEITLVSSEESKKDKGSLKKFILRCNLENI